MTRSRPAVPVLRDLPGWHGLGTIYMTLIWDVSRTGTRGGVRLTWEEETGRAYAKPGPSIGHLKCGLRSRGSASKYVVTARLARPMTVAHVQELLKVSWDASLLSTRRKHGRDATRCVLPVGVFCSASSACGPLYSRISGWLEDLEPGSASEPGHTLILDERIEASGLT